LPLLLCAFAISAFAADDSTPWNAPHFSLAPQALYTAASTPTPPEGTDVAVLTEEGAYVFDAQGRAVRTFYLVYKVLTQRGAEGWDTVSTSWGPWHEERPTLRARVITPDFAVHELDLKTVSDAPVKEDESSLYSDGRETRAPLPAIAPGSVVEEEIAVKESAPLFAAGTAASFYFGRVQVPVQHTRLVLDAPSSLALRYDLRLLPDMQPQRIESENRVKLVFESGPIAPQDPSEPNLPRDVPAFPEVLFSTGASWQKVAEDYAAIVDSHVGGAELRTLAERLTKGKHTPSEKASAIAEYLNKEVRYTGIEFGEAAVVPHSASETLVRKYGDCKDKATLLVAMLRAAGVPAYVALLHAGGRMDIPTDLPGMGMFDHAIAYVPASSSSDPDIWIDATDEYSRFGQLPAADQGRPALIARQGTTALVRIPESKSTDNVLRETREFYLAENGKARVVEISTPSGCFESQYRGIYADKENKGNHESLTSYMKSQYLAEGLDRMDRSEPKDFSKPFELVLESKKAGRGDTDLSSAVAAIRLEGLFYQLPNELKIREDPDEEKEKQKSSTKPKKPRTADYQLRQPFIAEWNYKIVPPSGFQAKPLPADAKVAIGPALLTEQFSTDPQGIVHGVVRFDSVKARFTVAEAAEMRNKIADLVGAEAILINFEPVGEALLKQGKVQEALASYRGLIAQHPNEAVHHLRLANVLLEAGIGEAARKEALLGVKLEPNSALAEKVLGDTLEYDLLGRRFRSGSDYAGAAAAYRAAMKLDPDDKNTVVALGYLLEQNEEGVRYGTGAKLKEAAAEYQKLTPAELARLGFQNNLPFALFYAGEFAAAHKNAETLNPAPAALMVAIEAATNGSQAAIAEANKRSQGNAQLKEILSTAGSMLMNSRKYQLASDLMQAGASGDDTARVMGLASILRQAKLHEQYQVTSDPVGAVNKFLLLFFDARLTPENLASLESRNARSATDKSDLEGDESVLQAGKQFRRTLIHSGLAPDVGIDIVMQSVAPQVDGSDASGYRVKLQLGDKKMTLFVVREEGKYKILDTSDKPAGVGLEVLDRLAAQNLEGARVLLDWVREEKHIEGGDDPLAGEAFPRLWTKGKPGDATQIKIAAAALLVSNDETAPRGLAILEAARRSVADAAGRTNIDLALLEGLSKVGNYDEMLAVSLELAASNPESRTVFLEQSAALRGLGRFDDANALAEQRLKQFPDELDAPRALTRNAIVRGDYRAAYDLGRKLADAHKAEAVDLNGMAWQTLFFERPEGPDIDSAVKASRLSQNAPNILHTLGCVYAEANKTKEAREVLLQAMDVAGMDEPNEAFWYAFGRIAEQYGELEVARADYARLTKPKKAIQIPDSSYQLAQNRLKKMAK
jgi:transglutaminase-like putative cysteine protease/tetratricopeptide (TPR) repeat protein